MIVLTKGQASQNMIVTLNEKRTLPSGFYLFVFTHFTTREAINIIYSFLADNSAYQDRFNSFSIATEAVFGTKDIGQWVYEVYEQASSTNTDTDGLTKVESGVMVLQPTTEFSRESYNQSTSFKQYAG